MGFIKKGKEEALAKEAVRAVEEGRTVFTPLLNAPTTHHGMTGAVPGWAELVESVEDAGWRLEHWSVAVDNKGKAEAYPLFRRV